MNDPALSSTTGTHVPLAQAATKQHKVHAMHYETAQAAGITTERPEPAVSGLWFGGTISIVCCLCLGGDCDIRILAEVCGGDQSPNMGIIWIHHIGSNMDKMTKDRNMVSSLIAVVVELLPFFALNMPGG